MTGAWTVFAEGEGAGSWLGAVCLAVSGSGIAFGLGVSVDAGTGTFDVVGPSKAAAGCKALGGSNAYLTSIPLASTQYWNAGTLWLILSGKMKFGRYDKPGNGVYHCSD